MAKMDDKTTAIVKTVAVDVVTLTHYRNQAVELVDFLRTQPCKTGEQEAWTSEQLSTVRALHKRFDDERMLRKRPILAAGKSIDSMFSPLLDPLKEAEDILRNKLAGAALGRLEREKAALLLAQAAASAGDTEQVMAALAEVPESVTTTGSSVKVVWEVATVDFGVLSDEFKTIDHARLAAVGKAAGAEAPSVAGVTWRQVGKVRAK